MLCCLCVATCGFQGLNLGSDESDIVLLGYAIIDRANSQVLGLQEYVIHPTNVDIDSNFLSEEVKGETTRLTEAAVRTSGVSLSKAISLFEGYCRSLGVDPSTILFITDGQNPLRQCLHPEASNKSIDLPVEYNTFVDLRKDAARYYQSDSRFTSLQDILTFLEIPNSGDASFFSKELRDMANVVQRMLVDGNQFNILEKINLTLEPGICSRDEDVDSNCVVRARGLPWQSSDQDIARFFRGLNVVKGGVALCLSSLGRRNGEALVRFESPEHRDMALKRHKHHIGQRYIEVYRACGEDFVSVAGGSSNEAQAFLTKGAEVIIRMRGLPYECTARQVIEFFESGQEPCSVMGGEEGLLFVRKPDGRSTGDAFVLFKDESDAPKALSRHRDVIGTRYIELFRSTTAEVQQVLNRTLETCEPPQILTPLPQVTLLPQHIITSGTRKDCIRLRGLPYEAQVEHILDFLGEHAKNILFQGVHMVYNSQGQPSGEAFIQMDSEASAFSAAQLKHHRYMSFGKKQRYIEVFQCSGEDMNLVLSGGLAGAPTQVAAAAAAAAAAVVAQQSPQQQPLSPSLAQPKPLLSPGAGYMMTRPLLYWTYPSPPVSPPGHLFIVCPDSYPIDQRWGLDYSQMIPPQPSNS